MPMPPRDLLNRELKVGDVVTYARTNEPAFATIVEIKTDGPIASRVWVSEDGKKPHRMPYPNHMMILQEMSEGEYRQKNKLAEEFNWLVWGGT